MKENWYDKWEADYIGSGDERTVFEQWFVDTRGKFYDDNEASETDLLNEFRDTQVWVDSFLDWAFVMEADHRIEQYAEETRSNQ